MGPEVARARCKKKRLAEKSDVKRRYVGIYISD